MGLRLDLYEQADDAMPNLFEVIFHGLPMFVGASNGRQDGQGLAGRTYQGLSDGVPCMRLKKFSTPSTGVKVKDINYMGAIIKVPLNKIDMDPTLSLPFRIDQNWQMYRDLCTWRNKVGDPGSARVGMDTFNMITSKLTGTRCDLLEVRALNRSHESSDFTPVRWAFNFAYPYKQSGVEFDYSGDQPIEITVDFGYLFMEEHFAKELYNVSFKNAWKQAWG